MYPRNRAALSYALALSLTSLLIKASAFAQSTTTTEPPVLPPVTVEQGQAETAKKPVKKKTNSAQKANSRPASGAGTPTDAATAGLPGAVGARSKSLTSPTAAEATAEINRTPGGVEVVPGSAYKTSTPATTVKDSLDYVPGVLIRPNEGEQATHFSIRGSGLSRNADARGVQFLMDGLIPLTRATGDTSFDEIDPNAFAYIEVYKGANALQYGANVLGGAVNYVSPTGYDAHLFGARLDVGSFGFVKWTATSGGVYGPADYYISLSGMQEDGYREHSDGDNLRGYANIGYKITPDAETRFYFSAVDVNRSFAGALTKTQALSNPQQVYRVPGPNNDNLEQAIGKDTESWRVANRTSLRLTPGTVLEFGAFYLNRDTLQSVFQIFDYMAEERGAFARVVDDRLIGGFRNRLIVGANFVDGAEHLLRFQNSYGNKGSLLINLDRNSKNRNFYAENSFYFLSDQAIVAGIQHVHAERDMIGYLNAGSGGEQYDFWNPKIGWLWDVTRQAQIFANVSRSGEAPTFTEPTTGFATNVNWVGGIEPQESTTFEVGTRGNYGAFRWDLSVYRSNITNEFQCLTSTPNTGFCTQVNIPKSIHQGVEAGGALALARGLFETGLSNDSLWLTAAYTFSDFRYDDDPSMGNNQLPGQPRHYLRAELLYKHPSGVYFGPNIEWMPTSYYVDNQNKVTVDSYHLWGAKLGFDNGGRISAYVEGRNLADEAYISSVSVASKAADNSVLFTPGTGRAVYSGIQFRW